MSVVGDDSESFYDHKGSDRVMNYLTESNEEHMYLHVSQLPKSAERDIKLRLGNLNEKT